MNMEGFPVPDEIVSRNEERAEDVKDLVQGGAEVVVGDNGEIQIIATPEQKAEAHAEMEESFANKEFAQKYQDKIGERVTILLTNPVVAQGSTRKILVVDIPVLDKIFGTKKIEAELVDVSDGRVSFEIEGKKFSISTALVEDIIAE